MEEATNRSLWSPCVNTHTLIYTHIHTLIYTHMHTLIYTHMLLHTFKRTQFKY